MRIGTVLLFPFLFLRLTMTAAAARPASRHPILQGGLYLGLGHTERVTAAAWSPDGKTLAAARGDHTIVLWDASRRMRRVLLSGHTGAITDPASSPGGRTLATSSDDGSVRLWDGVTGKERMAFYSLDGGKEWLAITPEGHLTASAHGAQVVMRRYRGRLWPVGRLRGRFERPELVRKALAGQPDR